MTTRSPLNAGAGRRNTERGSIPTDALSVAGIYATSLGGSGKRLAYRCHTSLQVSGRFGAVSGGLRRKVSS